MGKQKKKGMGKNGGIWSMNSPRTPANDGRDARTGFDDAKSPTKICLPLTT